LGALDEQIAFELGDGVDDAHCHFSSRTGEIDASKHETMDADADLFEPCDSCADIDSILVLSRFSPGLFRAMFAMKEIWNGKEIHRRVPA